MYGAFSPDTSRLLSGGDGATPEVHIWDVDTGSSLRIFKGHKQPVAALGWTENQRLVASGAFDGDVRVWDVSSAECLRVLSGHRS
jgi:WD40 repeat protein